jgi:hypothetical protein
MGAGNGIRLASLPAVLLLTPWGTFTRELVRLALEHSGRTSARAGNRVAGGGSAVTLQRDAAEVHACRRAARAYRREPGHGRARQPAEHRSPSVRSAADRARGCRRFAVRCHYQSDSPEFTGATRETVASAVLCSLAGRGVGFVAGTRAVVDAMSSVSTGAVSIIGGGGRGASR